MFHFKNSHINPIQICVEYQLYFYLQMTQVIIPTPRYASDRQQTNAFPSLIGGQGFMNNGSEHSFHVSKKSNSAFKFYKEKKVRTQESNQIQAPQFFEQSLAPLKKVYKLKIKAFSKQLHTDSTNFQRKTDHNLDYFDPNTALTFVEQGNRQFYLKAYEQKIHENGEKKSIQIHQPIKVQNKIIKQIQPIQTENQFQMMPLEGKQDDAFIIVKKICVKKAKRLKNNQQNSSFLKKSHEKKLELKISKLSNFQSFLNQQLNEIVIKQQAKLENLSELTSVKMQALKLQRSLYDQKELANTQKGSDKKEKKEGQMEVKCLAPNFILKLQLDNSSSEFQPLVFDTLNKTKVTPMIK